MAHGLLRFKPNLRLRVKFKFVRIAVDWLLRSDIGGYPDYQIPKKPAGQKKAEAKKSEPMNFRPDEYSWASDLRSAISPRKSTECYGLRYRSVTNRKSL